MKYLLDGAETERLLFRKIAASDFNDWLVFHQDASTSLYWNEAKSTAIEECTKWYAKQFNRYNNELGGMNALVEKETGRLVGHCGLLVQTVDGVKELEIAYSLLPAWWNKGYATEAAANCRDIAFKNNYSDSLISIISVANIPSEKVAVKIGMMIEKQTVYNGNWVNIFRIKKH